MKIRTAMLYALVILLLAGLTATAWYYWLIQGGSVLLPVFVSLLSLSLAVYGLIKTAWQTEPDVQQLQRQQQRRELRHYLKQTGRRLRHSGGAPRWHRSRSRSVIRRVIRWSVSAHRRGLQVTVAGRVPGSWCA